LSTFTKRSTGNHVSCLTTPSLQFSRPAVGKTKWLHQKSQQMHYYVRIPGGLAK